MTKISKWLQNSLALLLVTAIIIYILCNTTDNPRYHLILDDREMLFKGMLNTLIISLITLFLSMVLGFLMFLMMKSKIQFIKAISILFKEIVMGTPLLVMIFIAVYVLGDFFKITDKLLLGIVAITLYMSPYLSNSYQSAIEVIDEDQYMVMNLYNFTTYQKYRYVIIPQMIKPLVPSLINNLSSTVKGSALLKVVSISEISYIITVISSKNWASIEGYLVMWIAYLIITIPLSILAQYIGKRLST